METMLYVLMFFIGIVFAVIGAYVAFVVTSKPKKQKRHKAKQKTVAPKETKTATTVNEETPHQSPLNKIEPRESYTEMECAFEETNLKARIIENSIKQDQKYTWQ